MWNNKVNLDIMVLMFKRVSSVILFLLLFFVSAKTAYAKDYSIQSADFKVQINSDGSADVTEQRTYNFDGSYSWVDEWINLSSKFKV